jgi:hypothetical protein
MLTICNCFLFMVIRIIWRFIRAIWTNWSSSATLTHWSWTLAITITFLRLRHPIEFPYILVGIILDRVHSISDLRVIMDSRIYFAEHVNITFGKALAMLGFVKRMSGDFRNLYTLKTSLRTLYVLFVRSNLEYASCVWGLFDDFFSSSLFFILSFYIDT